MKEKDTISKGPSRRDETCYQVLHDIIIPAGTILRQEWGKNGVFACAVAGGRFTVDDASGRENDHIFKRVIA